MKRNVKKEEEKGEEEKQQLYESLMLRGKSMSEII